MFKSLISIAILVMISNPVNAGNVRAANGASATVATSAVGAFQCLVGALEATGYKIQFMGGWRRHGSVRGSLHPAGLALDINQLRRNVTRPVMPANEVALANGCGLVSGAQWANGDSGHFQLGGWAGSGRRATRMASRNRHHRSPTRLARLGQKSQSRVAPSQLLWGGYANASQ